MHVHARRDQRLHERAEVGDERGRGAAGGGAREAADRQRRERAAGAHGPVRERTST